MTVKGLKLDSLNSSDDVSGLVKVVPSSVAVGSGTGSANTFGTVTFSGASSVSLNNVFSATYQSYLLLVNLTDNSNNDADIFLKWRNAGTDSSASYYSSYTGINTLASPAVINKTQDPATEGHAIGKMDNSTKNSQYITVDIVNSFVSNFTTCAFKGFGSTDASNLFSYNGGGNHRVTQSYDGLSLIAQNGNFTGTISVLGYN